MYFLQAGQVGTKFKQCQQQQNYNKTTTPKTQQQKQQQKEQQKVPPCCINSKYTQVKGTSTNTRELNTTNKTSKSIP